METTNKKECPKCGSKKVIETRSGMGPGGEGNIGEVVSYKYTPLVEVFYECEDCHEPFSYKKE